MGSRLSGTACEDYNLCPRYARACSRTAKEGTDPMHGFSLRLRLVGSVLLLGGCINAQNTRMPTLAVGDPRATRQGYQVHDPLPDIHDGGGYMNDAVPRGFDRQRTEPRQAADRAASVGYAPRGFSNPSTAQPGNVVAP